MNKLTLYHSSLGMSMKELEYKLKKRLYIAFLSVIMICLTIFANPIYAKNENTTIISNAAVNQNNPGIVTIYLIRHGQTILNLHDACPRLGGWTTHSFW